MTLTVLASEAMLGLAKVWRRRVVAGRPQAVNVGFVSFVLYGVWAVRDLRRHSIYDLAEIDRHFLAQGHGSSKAIDALAPHASAGGYDGQFSLYIALDPFRAHHYLDNPNYRLGRVFYPLAARVVAVGQSGAIPWALLFLNIAAVVIGTYALALVLVKSDVSAWFALLFGCSPALFSAVDRDLTEPLAYALVILAVLALSWDRFLVAAVVFGLAGITRETTLLFPLAIVVAAAAGRLARRRPLNELALFASFSLAPYIFLRLVLVIVLGRDLNPDPALSWVPFDGLISRSPFGEAEQEQLYVVLAPGLTALAAALLLTRRVIPATITLALNVIGLIVLLPARSYESFLASGRIGLGVVVAFVLCLPDIPREQRLAASALPALMWFAPWNDLFQAAFFG